MQEFLLTRGDMSDHHTFIDKSYSVYVVWVVNMVCYLLLLKLSLKPAYIPGLTAELLNAMKVAAYWKSEYQEGS